METLGELQLRGSLLQPQVTQAVLLVNGSVAGVANSALWTLS
jgi:hypothetical protein